MCHFQHCHARVHFSFSPSTSLSRSAFLSGSSATSLNVPCLGPRLRSGSGRPEISRQCSGCTEAGRSVAGQLGAGARRQQPLPTATGTPWLRFGGRASGGRSVSRSVGRSIAHGTVNQRVGRGRNLHWLSLRPNCCTRRGAVGGLSRAIDCRCYSSRSSMGRGQGAVRMWALMMPPDCLEEVMLRFDAGGPRLLFVPEA